MHISNRRVYRDYQISDKLEVGLVLSGAEVKSIKGGHMQLEESFVRFKDGELWLENAHIHPYGFADNRTYDPRRRRKLLAHKKELLKIKLKVDQGMSLVALACYNKGRNLKLEIGVARSKKNYEKREVIKKRDIQREVEVVLRGKS